MKAKVKETNEIIKVELNTTFQNGNVFWCQEKAKYYFISELEFLEDEKPTQAQISGMTHTLFNVIAFSISAIISAVSVFKTYEQHNWLLFTVSIVLTIWCLFRFTKNCDKLPK